MSDNSGFAFHSSFGLPSSEVTSTATQVRGDLFSAFSEVIGETPEIAFVFTTGPKRSSFYQFGGIKSAAHHTVDATLAELAEQKKHVIHLKYLSNTEEASYGFETLLEHSKDVLDDAISKAGIADGVVGVTTSGTTSFQSGVYDRATGTISRMDAFDYGTNNRNPEGLEAYRTWMATQEDVRCFVSIGSESYAAPKGKIATNQVGREEALDVLSDLDSSARAYEPVQDVLNIATAIGKAYYVPERKTWDAKTSATLALRKIYTSGVLLDWGGGQIKNEETGKKVNFDQRTI